MSLELPVLGTLPESWEVVPFGEVLDGGTRNGIYKKKEFHGRGARIVNMGELFGHPRLFDVEMKRVELTEKEIAKAGLEAGDLLFARRSLVAEGAGKCSLVCEVNEPTTFESSIIRARPDASKVDSHFLYYMFSSPFGKYILGTIRRTVAVSGITGTDLVTLEIPVPPLPEQRAIASILGALDDKIELNRRMNATLESLARAIFKSWFVDFDPVHVNAGKINAGQMPASSAIPTTQDPKVLDLFPSTFQDSELGPIPEGWSSPELKEILGERGYIRGPFGSSLKRADMVGEGIPVYEQQHAIYGTREFRYFIDEEKHEKLKRFTVQEHDLIISCSGTVGRISIIRPSDPTGIISQALLILRPEVSNEFLYYFLTSPTGYNSITSVSTGSVQVNIAKRKIIETIRLVVPPPPVLEAFDELAVALRNQMRSFNHETAQLERMRDIVLPQLLSGELPVPAAMTANEEVLA